VTRRTRQRNTVDRCVPHVVHSAEMDGSARQSMKRVPAVFFRTAAGNEPLREWLKSLEPRDRKTIREDIKTVEYGWPLGMPLCRGHGLHEVRARLSGNRIARIVFYIDGREQMVLLHGFIKKTAKTPEQDLKLARANKEKHERSSE
jgi:phage-related protein